MKVCTQTLTAVCVGVPLRKVVYLLSTKGQASEFLSLAVHSYVLFVLLVSILNHPCSVTKKPGKQSIAHRDGDRCYVSCNSPELVDISEDELEKNHPTAPIMVVPKVIDVFTVREEMGMKNETFVDMSIKDENEIFLSSDDETFIDLCDSDIEELQQLDELDLSSVSEFCEEKTFVAIDEKPIDYKVDKKLLDIMEVEKETESGPSIKPGNADEEKNNEPRTNFGNKSTKRLRKFKTKGCYTLYCSKCHKMIEKIRGKKMTHCKSCTNRLDYECIRCKKHYLNFTSLYLHLKFNCFRESASGKTAEGFKSGKKKLYTTKNLYQFYCTKCGVTVPKEHRVYMKNCRTCETLLEFRCLSCEKQYKSFFGLYMHLKTVCAVQSEFEDEKIEHNEAEETEEREHSISYESMRPYLCLICNEDCNDQNEILECNGERVFQCYYCSYGTCHKSNFKEHMQQVKHEPTMMGASSSSKPDDDDDFSKDYKNATENVQIVCFKCKCIHDDADKLEDKINCKNCNIAFSFRCKHCKREYSSEGALYSHIKFECNRSPKFACQHCDYKAKQKGNLRSHIRRKHTMKKCSGCSKEFSSNIVLRQHQYEECHKKVCFKCRLCTYTCKYRTNMEDHIRDVHKSKYECGFCGKRYKYLNSLRKHVKNLCELDSVMQCHHCSYTTLRKIDLSYHLRRKHPDVF